MPTHVHGVSAHAHGVFTITLLSTVDTRLRHGGSTYAHGGSAVEMIRYITSSNDTTGVDTYGLVDKRAEYQSSIREGR
ncbi:hypothetical protein Y032_0007g3323 [Ancylostoma ceylanicum]|uniref:Uncharacterized protein n=1 Tax=Ancylostoma ceylanicum TaxID=53326 RepID=A0A016VNN7_9BILA|nr:hypothetical protein Y032_0007g3323 [Ancylostoma ceylanicum]